MHNKRDRKNGLEDLTRVTTVQYVRDNWIKLQGEGELRGSPPWVHPGPST